MIQKVEPCLSSIHLLGRSWAHPAPDSGQPYRGDARPPLRPSRLQEGSVPFPDNADFA